MYMLINHGWEPSKFNDMPISEKAFVIACIDREVAARPKTSNNTGKRPPPRIGNTNNKRKGGSRK
jgi:hypothetical protein